MAKTGPGRSARTARTIAPLCFHGGIDTQQVLPFGTADEVRAAVRCCRDITRERGGYILCGSQQFQGDVPPANIAAICDENVRAG